MTATINGLPLYEALVTDSDTGMIKISLVDSPAVMSDFQKFSAGARRMRYRVQDEERRLVRGVVMRTDYPILRMSEDMGEYYVIYRAPTIRKMAEKYLLESRQNKVDLMHDGKDVEGVQMVQFFIKDTAAGIDPEGFGDIADGSLFAEFHIVSDTIWESVKEGTYRGFSLEGLFNLVQQETHGNNQQPMKEDMKKLSKIKAAIVRILTEFGSTTTDKGILSWDGEEDLKAGDAIFHESEDGKRTPAEDGDYRTADGKVIKVSGGKVTEIVDDEAEVSTKMGRKDTDKGALEWDGESDLKAGDNVYVSSEDGERSPAPDGDYKTEDGKVIRVKDGKVAEIVDEAAEVATRRISELESENESLRVEKTSLAADKETLTKERDSLKTELEKLRKTSERKPAHEEFKSIADIIKTGDKGLDRLAKVASAR